METADDHILEAFALNFGPVLNLIAGNILYIARHVEAGIGVGTLGTNGRHQLVVLVGDKVLGSQLADTVYLVIGLTALGRIGQCAILFVAGLDISQSGGLCRVVLRTGTHGNKCIQTGFLLVDTQVHFQTIVERVDTRL